MAANVVTVASEPNEYIEATVTIRVPVGPKPRPEEYAGARNVILNLGVEQARTLQSLVIGKTLANDWPVNDTRTTASLVRGIIDSVCEQIANN